MASALNDIFQLKVFYSNAALTNSWMNVFWYKLADMGALPPGSFFAGNLQTTFNDNVKNAVLDCICTDSVMMKYETVNYAYTLDWAVGGVGLGLPDSGTRTGDPIPPAICMSIRFDRPAPGFRNGWKRLAQLSELDVTGSTITAGLRTLADNAAAAMLSSYMGASAVWWQPIVATGVKLLGINPSSWDIPSAAYAGIGTQNSRKRGLLG